MKSFKLLSILLLLALTITLLPALGAAALEYPEATAKAYVLADTKNGVILCAVNEYERLHPASTTKIMTVMLALELVDKKGLSLEDLVTATETCKDKLEPESSVADIQPGETISLMDLLYCAMVASANDACNVIAEYTAGSISNFVSLMNSRAAELGCKDTHFSNPHGMPEDDHYTTAYDLYLITMQALKNYTFEDIFGTSYIEIQATNISNTRKLTTTNALINAGPNNSFYYKYATGGKTGYTSAAGNCLVSTAEKEDISLISVVMGAPTFKEGNADIPQHFGDSVKLFDWGFTNFSYREILRSTEVVKELPVAMGSGADTVSLRPESSISILLANDDDLQTFQRLFNIFNDDLTAPIEAGTVLGEVTISRAGVVYGSSRLVATNSISLSRLEYLKGRLNETMEKPIVRRVFWVLVALFSLYLLWLTRYYILRFRHRHSVRMARRVRREQEAMSHNGQIPGAGYGQTMPPRDTGEYQLQASQRIPIMDRSQRIPTVSSEDQIGNQSGDKTQKGYDEGFFEDFFN